MTAVLNRATPERRKFTRRAVCARVQSANISADASNTPVQVNDAERAKAADLLEGAIAGLILGALLIGALAGLALGRNVWPANGVP